MRGEETLLGVQGLLRPDDQFKRSDDNTLFVQEKQFFAAIGQVSEGDEPGEVSG